MDDVLDLIPEISGYDPGVYFVEASESSPWEDHPMMTTSFSDYSVVEGLLLLIFVILFLQFFLNLLRRWL